MSQSRGVSALPLSLLRAPWRWIIGLDRLVRLHFFGASLMISLLGAASVSSLAVDWRLGGLILVTFFLHVFAYVLNDIVDLPVDRLQPSRAMDPLVRGVVSPSRALGLALVQIPLALGVTWLLDPRPYAYSALAVGFSLMAVYDVWGKRFAVPPVTDAAQGIAWGSLAIYGAGVMGRPNFLTFVVGAYMAGFILLINGVHGGLRDLENDRACGRRTTAIFFGARTDDHGAIRVPFGIRSFSLAVQVGLIMLIASPLMRNDFGYSPAELAATATAVGLSCVANLVLLFEVFRPDKARWQSAFRVHLVFLLVTLMVAFLPYLAPWMRALLVVEFFAPLLLIDRARKIVFGRRRRRRRTAVAARRRGSPDAVD